MTRLTDGKIILEITMNNWIGDGFTPDWSAEFYDVGCLHYNAELDAYQVKDVDYCVNQALDWQSNTGDYIDYDADPEEVESRNVYCQFIYRRVTEGNGLTVDVIAHILKYI